MPTRKDHVRELVAQGRHLEARAFVLSDPEAYTRGDALPVATAPAAPAAPAPAAPATAPAPPQTAQAFRAEVERLNALGPYGELAARAMVAANPQAYIDGRPSNPPAAPVATPPAPEPPK